MIKHLFDFVREFKWKKVIGMHVSQKTPSTSNFLTSDYWLLSRPLQIQNNPILPLLICTLQNDEVQIAFPMTDIFDHFFIHSKRKGIKVRRTWDIYFDIKSVTNRQNSFYKVIKWIIVTCSLFLMSNVCLLFPCFNFSYS